MSAWPTVAVLMLVLLAPSRCGAQPGLPFDRPSDLRPTLPRFEADDDVERLPRLQVPQPEELDSTWAGARLFVRAFRITGNTVLPEEVVRSIVAPYAGRSITNQDLEALRDALTHAYLEAGYATSGAWVPSQRVEDGVLEIRMHEGTLGRLTVEVEGRLRPVWADRRLQPALQGPLNLHRIEERLQILYQDPLVIAVDAELVPGEQRGTADLQLQLREAPLLGVALQLDNHEPPTVGEATAGVQVSLRDATGFGDLGVLGYRRSYGFQDLVLDWRVPLPGREEQVGLFAQYGTSRVVEEPFSDLDIESRSFTAGIGLSVPLQRSLRSDLRMFSRLEWRRTRTYLLGSAFSFVAGPEDGVSTVTVLRLGPEWTYRDRHQVLAARSTLSLGLDLFDATVHGGSIPDGRFVSWLTQLQWLRRLPWPLRHTEVLVRADAQLSDDPLLGLEQFAIGGWSSVRGFREDLLVRDGAVVGSIEIRLPVLRRADETPRLELAPFVDAGHGWNRGRPALGPSTLTSVGIGARLALGSRARLEVYWAKGFQSVPSSEDWTLQDHGVHARLAVDVL